MTYQRSLDTHFENCGVPGWQSAAERVYLRAKVYGRTRLCLLDSGSEVTLIPTGLIDNRKIQWTQRKIWTANGMEIPVKGWISLTAYTDGSCVEICGLVTDHVSDIFWAWTGFSPTRLGGTSAKARSLWTVSGEEDACIVVSTSRG